MSLYCITSSRGVGCTFFDWSMHFLSGQEKFYNIKDQDWMPVVADPVQRNNAHGHLKNHPSGFATIQEHINHVLSISQDPLYSIYPARMLIYRAVSDLNIPINQIGSSENQLKINQYIKNDFDQLFEFCNRHSVKLIYVGDDPSVQLYYLTVRTNSPKMSNGQVSSPQESAKDNQQIFFNNSINTWRQLNLTNIWDQREQQALDTRPLHYADTNFKNMTYPHMWISCQELWYNGEDAALRMLKYLNLNAVSARVKAWRPIYKKWQQKQLQILKFNFNCQHIVDSIVNNWYYEIDLTFDQEVVIQHCLLYQHNLNLKTWQLTKFPNNTQDLHKLLVPNTHSLTPY